MSEVHVVEASKGKRFKQFMRVGRSIHAGDLAWVPPLEMDLAKTLRSTYPFFDAGIGERFLALRDGKPVGRISAQVNFAHLDKYQDGRGFFGWFESIDDQSVVDALVARAATWLRDQERDLTHVRGPFNWSINGECPGVLVKNERPGPPSMLMAHNPCYYPERLEAAGFAKCMDLFAWWVGEERKEGELRFIKVAERLKKRLEGLTMRPVDLGKGYKADMEVVRQLYNDAWAENWGSVDIMAREMRVIADGLKMIVNPSLTRLAFLHGEPIGCIICIPDLNPTIQKIGGRLFPFGVFKILSARKDMSRLRTMILGVKRDHRKRGIEALLVSEIIRDGRAQGCKGCELSWVLESNDAMNSLAAGFATQDRSYRVYEKAL